jgi:hypothetical protein
MCGHDLPSGTGADPGLTLPTRGAGAVDAELGVRCSEVAAEGRDDGVHQVATEIDGRPAAPKGRNGFRADVTLRDAVAHRSRAVPKQLIQNRKIVFDQRALVATEGLGDLGEDLGGV